MFSKIIAFFISAIYTIINLLGLGGPAIGVDDSNCKVYANLSYGSYQRQFVDLAIPDDNAGEVGLILFIHGGGWLAGDKDIYKDALSNTANNFGYAAAALNYRYLSKNVDMFDIADDIDSALAIIKEKAKENGVEINKVLLTGGSAGGHLSMFYAYSKKDTAPITPTAVVSYSGPTDLYDDNFYFNNPLGTTEFICKLFSMGCGQSFTYEEKDKVKDALYGVSPISYVDESTVPTVICHGMKDSVVPYSNALSIVEKFEQYGVTYDFISYPNSEHGLESDPDCAKQADRLLLEYAEKYLK